MTRNMKIIEKFKDIVRKCEDADNNDFNLSILLSLFLVSIIWILIGTLKFSIDEEFIINNYIVDASSFYNNTGKNLQYISLLIGFPILFFIFFNLISKGKISKIKKFRYTNLLLKVIILSLSFFCIFCLCTSILSGIIVSILLVLMYIVLSKCKLEKLELIKNKKNLKFIIIVISILTSLLYIDTTYQKSFFLMHHVTAYYYPIHKVLNGLTPYIDFNSLYGGYSYVFALILSFFSDNLHLLIFSFITSILVFISLYFTYKFLNKIIENKTVVLLTFLSILFCSIFYIYIVEDSTYLQFFPHRYLFIIIMLNHLLSYLKCNSIKNTLIGYLICSIAMFWNFESGAILLISWSMLLLYDIIYNKDYKRFLFVLLSSSLSIVLYLFIIEIITFIRVGYFSNLKDILFSMLFFSNGGFLSLKLIISDEPWIIMLILYLFYLGKTIVCLINKSDREDSLINFYLSILGLGLFVYYLERPMLLRFLLVCFPFLMLIAKNNKRILTYVFILELSCSILCLIGLEYAIFKRVTSNEISKDTVTSYEWLKKFSDDIGKDNFEMFINCDIIYYELLGKRDYKETPSYLDLFTIENLNEVVNYIENSDKNIILSLELYMKYTDRFYKNKKITEKYDLYYKYDKKQFDNYIYFIKKEDISKITDIEDYKKIEKLKLEVKNG